MPPPGASSAWKRSSAIGSPKRMKRPPLQVPTATCPSIDLTLVPATTPQALGSAECARTTIVTFVTGADTALLAGLVFALFLFLWIDLHFFARGREPSFREAVIWSIGWLALSLLAAIPVLVLEGGEDAVLYTTVYLIERSLSLDNLFVFLLLFSYFGVPYERRPRLLFWGIVAALAMRGVFILLGTELIEQFHVVIYLLGAALIVLAYRIWRGVADNVNPDKNLMVRAVRRIYPVTGEFHDGHWFVKKDGRRHATPIFLCLAAIVFADIAFAIDSIPAAFAITTDPLLIWMGNVFALLGMRALFVLVESLVERFRYLDETIAIVLGLVGVKLLVEDLVKVGPVASLAIIAVAFTVGIALSIRADRNDPDADEHRRERSEAMRQGAELEHEEREETATR
jgi:tellurite resistance protein TerC